jgi:hypothetical protein
MDVVQGRTSFLTYLAVGVDNSSRSSRSGIAPNQDKCVFAPRVDRKVLLSLQDLVVIVSSPGVVTVTDAEQDHHAVRLSTVCLIDRLVTTHEFSLLGGVLVRFIPALPIIRTLSALCWSADILWIPLAGMMSIWLGSLQSAVIVYVSTIAYSTVVNLL